MTLHGKRLHYYPFGMPMPGRSFVKQVCYDVVTPTPVTDLANEFTNSTEGYTGTNSTLDASTNELVVSKNSGNLTFGTSRVFTITQSGTDHTLTFNLTQMATDGVNILCRIDTITVDTLSATGIDTIYLSVLDTGSHTLTFVTDGQVTGSNRLFAIDDVTISYKVPTPSTICGDADIAYRYGFNGQEKDDEVKGKGNSLDFKFRVHDSRLGRFLSVDPLEKHFAWNSSYSFAMNRVIDGIDLEGLEYLESDKARIKIIGGRAHINLQNFNSVTRYLWNKRDNESSIPGYIGWPTQIGELSHPYLPSSQLVTLDNAYLVADPSRNPFLIQKQGLRKDGQIDNRVKKPVNRPNSSSRVRGVSGFVLTFNAINWGLGSYGNSLVKEDVELVTEHTSILKKQVMEDLTEALERGMIPKEYLNVNDIGNIANVVLSGVNLTNDKKIYEIGMTIVREISDKRIKTTIHDDRYSMGITPADATSVDNSIHDYSSGPANDD